PVGIERFHQQARVADLPPVGAAHEAAQLSLDPPAAPGRLLLERAERPEVALRLEHSLDRRGTERADQLVLEILDANVEAELRHVVASEPGTETRAFEAAAKDSLLARVAQTGEPSVRPLRAEPRPEPADRLRAP